MAESKHVRDLSAFGLKPPEKVCNDPLCPRHGEISVRGTVIVGVVEKARMHRTVVVRRDYLHYMKKYKRYEKRSSKFFAHNPPCIDAKEGDIVKIMETRPISKGTKFVVVEVVKRAERRFLYSRSVLDIRRGEMIGF